MGLPVRPGRQHLASHVASVCAQDPAWAATAVTHEQVNLEHPA
jgi:hypothetical protein